MTNAAGKLSERLRREGIGSAVSLVRTNLAHLYWRWCDSRFDRKYGVTTSAYILPKDLDVKTDKKALSSEYEPSSGRILKTIFDQLNINFGDYAFIDYGSGMGRVLLVASEYPFKQIIGIELSPNLHGIAQANIEAFHSKRKMCHDVRSICMDAEVFELPKYPCVIYLFDPFRKETIEKVCRNIEHSYLDQSRDIFIIYYAPVHREIFDAAECVREYDALKLPRDMAARRQYEVVVYRTIR